MPIALVGPLTLALLLSNLPVQEEEKSTPPREVSPRIQQLIDAHNQEREREKRPPLRANPKLMAAAQHHAQDMADRQKLTHHGLNASNPSERIKEAGYKPRRTGENIAEGQETIKELMKEWMKSPTHRNNILGDFSEMGAAEVLDKAGRPYWVVDFGEPMPELDPKTAAPAAVDRINQIRARHDLPALTVAPSLSKAAQILADEQYKYTSSRPPEDGSRIAELVRNHGYDYRELRQVRASGYRTPESFVEDIHKGGGLASPFFSDFHDVGAGFSQDKEGKPYWVLLLASPRQVP